MDAIGNKPKKPRGKPFEKGNKHGNRFKPGESGNPDGRPKCDISPARILEELARLAFLDPREFFDDEGRLRPIKELPEDAARAIAGIEHDDLWEDVYEGKEKRREKVGITSKIRLIQKTEALKMLGQYHKLFTDRTEVVGLQDFAATLSRARARASTVDA